MRNVPKARRKGEMVKSIGILLLPFESYENFCFSIFTFAAGCLTQFARRIALHLEIRRQPRVGSLSAIIAETDSRLTPWRNNRHFRMAFLVHIMKCRVLVLLPIDKVFGAVNGVSPHR